jgi:hypothetical protein
MGKYEEALAASEKMYSLLPDAHPDPELGPLRGIIFGRMGRRSEAKKVLDGLRAASEQWYVPWMDMALVHLGFDQLDQTFEMLEKAYEARDPALLFLKSLPPYENLHSDPRTIALLKKMGMEK